MSRSGFDRDGGFATTTGQNLLSNIGSVASTKPEAKYHSGARCVLKVNGKLLGFAFAVSWNIQTDNTEIRTVDSYLPAELAPRVISVSGSLGTFVIPGRSATSEMLQSDVLSFLQNKYITIEVSDSTTGSKLFSTNRAVITGQQVSIQTEQLTVAQLSWKAIGWQAEFAPEEPTGSDRDSAILGGFAGAANSLRGK
jgi:hypothetical protein